MGIPLDTQLIPSTRPSAVGINDLGQVVGYYYDSSGKAHGFLYSGGSYIPLNDPSGTDTTFAFGINDAGQVVGYYVDSGTHGFLYSGLPIFPYTTLNGPSGASGAQASGINDAGQIVGTYFDSSHTPHGFIYSGGTYTPLNDPSGADGTFALGINSLGLIVGYYYDSSHAEHGFLYHKGVLPSYGTLNDPLGADGTVANGINDDGQIVGNYEDSSGVYHGFLYYGGFYTTIDDALGTEGTILSGINNAGEIAGVYFDSSGTAHSFLATPPPTTTSYTFSTFDDPLSTGTEGTIVSGVANGGNILAGNYYDSGGKAYGFAYLLGSFLPVNVPGSTSTYVVGINDAGQIIGGYTDSSGEHGFIYNHDSGGTYITLNDPLSANGLVGTQVNGINDAGQVVGDYADSSGVHGFLYSGGNYTTLNGPLGTGGARALGINDEGQIVGNYEDSSGAEHGFLDSGGNYITLDDPLGTKGTFAYGINDLGQIVGYYKDSNGAEHGFLYSDGNYTTLGDPSGAEGTAAYGINDAGLIVGQYFDSSGTGHGFVAVSASATASPTSVQQEILGLYAALYNRAADFDGYPYWVGVDGQQSDSGGVTVANAGTTAVTLNDAQVLGQDFVNTQSTFYNATYGNLLDSDFVTALYVNIAGNAGDQGGISYWEGLLKQAEMGGASVQAARAGLVGQFVHDLIGVDLTPGAAALGLTAAQYQDALTRQAIIDNKIAVSLAYLNASQQPDGGILDVASVGSPAYTAAVAVIQGVTSDPGTVTVAVTGINTAVAHQDLASI